MTTYIGSKIIKINRYLLLISFLHVTNGIKGDVIDVLVNDLAALRCSVDSSVDIQWHFDSPYNFVYAGGKLRGPYKDRFRLEIDSVTRTYILIIPTVNKEDAGMYYCSEEARGRQISSTRVTVLSSDLVCNYSTPRDVFISPNTCRLQRENLTIGCTVPLGVKSPQLIWQSVSNSQPYNSACDFQTNRVNCNLTLTSDAEADGSIFICETSALIGAKYNCNIVVVKIDKFSESNATEKNMCKNSSCIVSRNIRIYDDGKRIPSSSNQNRIQRHDIGHCELTYNIRNVTCFVLVDAVFAESSPRFSENGEVLVISLSLTIGLILAATSIVAAICVYRRRTRDGPVIPQCYPLNIRTSPTDPVIIRPAEEQKAIYGVAVLHEEIFFVTKGSNEFQVYSLQEFSFKRSCQVNLLVNPRNIVSCCVNKCLYIENKVYVQGNEGAYAKNGIIKVTTSGESKTSWPIKKEISRISVTSDGRIVVPLWDFTKLYIYSSDGKRSRKIKLASDLGIRNIRHVIFFEPNYFILSHGDGPAEKHRVCIVDKRGHGVSIVGNVAGDSLNLMNIPAYLAKVGSNSILVADRNNRRILLFSSIVSNGHKAKPNLNDPTVLVSLNVETEILNRTGESESGTGQQKPWRICLDQKENFSMLFVIVNQTVANKAVNGRIYVYSLAYERPESQRESQNTSETLLS